jgi:hypothetical protein
MAQFRTREIASDLAAEPLFTTINDKKEVLLTSGTYIIASKPAKGELSEKFKSTYTNGTAPANELYNPKTDTILVYPVGYFGVEGASGNIVLNNTEKVQETIKINQIKFIQKKVNVKVEL